MTSSDTTDTTSESRGDKLVARKPRQEGKNILLYSVEDFLKWLLISFQTSSLVVLLLTIVTNVTNGLVNVKGARATTRRDSSFQRSWKGKPASLESL